MLALPFEALQLPDGRPLALIETVTLQRRLLGPELRWEPLAGPFKVLVAVAAPDRGGGEAVLLDHEREVALILEALEPLRRIQSAQVRLLDVGHPEQIREALHRDPYHVLHLSCHGRPGELQLETEDGDAYPCTAGSLLQELRRAGRPLPMILLSTCHGATPAEAPASLAEALVRGGVPAVLAMQAAISDRQATALAHAFYKALAGGERFLASEALAVARDQWERQRLQLNASGEALAAGYANATLLVGGEERRLADFGLDQRPLKVAPVHRVDGLGVPQLAMDELIGRRQLMRDTLRSLRQGTDGRVGVLLSGVGGVGKSAMAGRLMQRLREDGYRLVVQVGRWRLADVAALIGEALRSGSDGDPDLHDLAMRLQEPISNETVLFSLLSRALGAVDVLVVLDDFERNLSAGGEAFLDPSLCEQLDRLCQAMEGQRSKLLITSRHPLPDPALAAWLSETRLPPLSGAEMGKFLLRLPGIEALGLAERDTVWRRIGGHPRVLELLDALLRHGQARSAIVSRKLRALRGAEPLNGSDGPEAPEAIDAALALGARDVLLEELVALADGHGAGEVLRQLAVSNLPVSADGVAWMLAAVSAAEPEVPRVRAAMDHLSRLSLIYLSPNAGDGWVHRWIAEGLRAMQPPEAHAGRCRQAAQYRLWRVANQSHSLEDGIEAVRNFLLAEDFDAASSTALDCLEVLGRQRQAVALAALASEVLETLPVHHPSYWLIADQEASAHLALAQTSRAFQRYEAMQRFLEGKAKAEPDRADYQRDLSVSYNKMGDLYGALGQGEQAREAYAKALAIAERLAKAEPDRADVQVDLVISLVKVASLEAPPDLARLQKALGLLEGLAAEGRLSHEHQPKLAALRSMLGGG